MNICGESHDRFIVDWGQFDPWPLNLYSPGKKTGYQGGEVSKFGANCFLDKSLLSQALLDECRIKYNQVATNTEMTTTLLLVILTENLPKILTKVCSNISARRLLTAGQGAAVLKREYRIHFIERFW